MAANFSEEQSLASPDQMEANHQAVFKTSDVVNRRVNYIDHKEHYNLPVTPNLLDPVKPYMMPYATEDLLQSGVKESDISDALKSIVLKDSKSLRASAAVVALELLGNSKAFVTGAKLNPGIDTDTSLRPGLT